MTGPAALMQLVGVGLLWIGVHCVGMCGPLLVGLDIAGGHGATSVRRGLWRTVQYQVGKAVAYAGMGAVAGVVGAGLEAVVADAGGVMAVVLGVAAVGSVLYASVAPRTPRASVVRIGRARTAATLSFASAATTMWAAAQGFMLRHHSHPFRPVMTGAIMAFLPCMISLWALGLAALTASPLWGALVMSSLAVMTTPMLLLVSVFASSFARVRAAHRRVFHQALTLLAGTWLILVGAAGLDLIAHQHLSFVVAGRQFMVMFF